MPKHILMHLFMCRHCW